MIYLSGLGFRSLSGDKARAGFLGNPLLLYGNVTSNGTSSGGRHMLSLQLW